MNALIGKRYIGPDVDGREVSGKILHVGKYGKGSRPITYVILTDPRGNGKPGQAQAPAGIVHEHLDGLALVRSMDADSE